jgi:uncharacterized protein (DUF1697 family)
VIYTSLLRGINVGGNKTVKMSLLKELYESLGFKNVKTLLNSGNAVFESKDSQAKLEKTIEASILKKFGFEVGVVVVNPEQLKKIIKANPFKKEEQKDPSHLLMMFLKDDPNEKAFNEFKKSYEGHEKFSLGDKVLYVYYGTGLAKSKLTNVLLEKKLGTIGTARNWNTANKLLELMQPSS